MTFHDTMMEKVSEIKELASYGLGDIDEDYFEEIGDWFTKFTRAIPKNAGELAATLNQAATDLTINNEGTLDAIDTELHEWTGEAAEGFRGYIGQAKDAIEMQIDAIKAMSLLAETQQKMIEGMREDLRNIADNTIKALRDSIGGGGSLWGTAFSVLAAAAYVGSAVASGGASVAWAVVAGMASVASSAAPSASVGGDNKFDILESMMKALRDLREAVIQEQERLRAGLQAAIDFYADHYNEIQPSRPTIATPMEVGGQTGWGLDDFYPTPAT